jgi:hypothetical protein
MEDSGAAGNPSLSESRLVPIIWQDSAPAALAALETPPYIAGNFDTQKNRERDMVLSGPHPFADEKRIAWLR